MRITVKNRLFINTLSLGFVILVIAFGIVVTHANDRIVELESKVKSLESNISKATCSLVEKKLSDIESASALPDDITRAVIAIESSGKVNAYKADEGAVGLMQLRPVVYKKLCGLTKAEAFEPSRNVACGSLYLKSLLEKFSGNLEKALVYYNSGNAMIDTGYVDKVKEQINN